MWEASMAENRLIKLGKQCDFQCHQMEHQLGAYTGCNHGEGLAVLHPAYYRRICRDGLSKFVRFAVRVWGIAPAGKADEELALAGVQALADFIREKCYPPGQIRGDPPNGTASMGRPGRLYRRPAPWSVVPKAEAGDQEVVPCPRFCRNLPMA